jgi:hypothetical protein
MKFIDVVSLAVDLKSKYMMDYCNLKDIVLFKKEQE